MPFSRLRARSARRVAVARHAFVPSFVETVAAEPDDVRRRAVDASDRLADSGLSPAMRAALAAAPYEGPRVVLDLGRVADAYRALASGLGDVEIFYAIKANPNPAILTRLAALGAGFDVASRGEIERCLSLGIPAERISFGNTIKRETDIAYAYRAGLRLFAVDSVGEVEKVARAAPGASVFCRILVSNDGADWPLSRKFGCSAAMAEEVLAAAVEHGLDPIGMSFHVGSQTRDPANWRPALGEVARAWGRAQERLAPLGRRMSLIDLGGGFPAAYVDGAPPPALYAARVRGLVDEAFAILPEALRPTRMIAEPGRGLVGDAGVIEAEVLLVSRKDAGDDKRWVYLDIGKFGGLAETMDEAIRYRIVTDKDGDATAPCILAGPTCDSADVLYERRPVDLPLSLAPGDRVLIPATGAYTTTYSAVWFNGIAPLSEIVADSEALAAIAAE